MTPGGVASALYLPRIIEEPGLKVKGHWGFSWARADIGLRWPLGRCRGDEEGGMGEKLPHVRGVLSESCFL